MTKLHKQIAGQSATRISPARPLPLYYQLYETLRSQIQDGVWNNGDFFPPIPVLADQFDVATVTVRQALGLLQKDGLVQSRQGRGTVITSSALRLQPLQLESTVTEILDLYAEDSPDVESIDEGLAMPPLKASDFHLLPSYFFIKRVHIRHGGRYCLITFFLAEPLFPIMKTGFAIIWFYRFCSRLMILALPALGSHCVSKRRITQLATILKVSAGDPIARVKRYITNQQDELIYFADVRYRGDAIQYNIELKI